MAEIFPNLMKTIKHTDPRDWTNLQNRKYEENINGNHK